MASSIAVMTIERSIAFSRATASAICNSSSRLALTAIAHSPSVGGMPGVAGAMPSLLSFLFLRRLGLALGGLFAPQGLRHQFVGEHQPCFIHVVDRQQHVRLLAFFRVVAAHPRGLAFGADQQAAEALAPVDRNFGLDLHHMPGIAVEIGAAAPAGGRCRARKSPADRRGRSGRPCRAPARARARRFRSPRPPWFRPAVPP